MRSHGRRQTSQPSHGSYRRLESSYTTKIDIGWLVLLSPLPLGPAGQATGRTSPVRHYLPLLVPDSAAPQLFSVWVWQHGVAAWQHGRPRRRSTAFAASQHRSIAASQHGLRSIAARASQHPSTGFAASQHGPWSVACYSNHQTATPGAPPSQHRSMSLAAWQHGRRSMAARALEHGLLR